MANQEEYQPFPISISHGLYSRGARHHVPDGHLTTARNLTFLAHGQVGIRNSVRTVIEMSSALAGATIVRFHSYIRTGETPRLIVLDSAGKFWDVKVDGSVAPINILTIAGATDFTGLTLYNRFYFMPHDRVTGMDPASGGALYVYDPGVNVAARKAAGTKPASNLTLAVSATNGNVEPGFHVLAVSFKTNSGFLTAPAGHASVTSPSGTKKKIDVTTIATGGAAVTARWIWMSKAVKFYDGNLTSVPLFFVKEIADNSTVALTGASGIDAFDSALGASADKYTFNLEEIPAGVAMCDYDGSLVIVGEKANPSVARVAVSGDPEAFNSADGFISCALGDGEGLKNAASKDGVLFLYKSARSYGIRRLIDTPVNAWGQPDILDVGNGAECFGVARVLESNNPLLAGGLLIHNFAGMHAFNGAFPTFPLTRNIDQFWATALKEATVSDYTRSNTAVDPMNKRIYCCIGNRLLYGDYKDGLDSENIRWSDWTLPDANASVQFATAFSIVNKSVTVYYANLTGCTGGTTQIRAIESFPTIDMMDSYIPNPPTTSGANTQIPIDWEIETAPIQGFPNTVLDHIGHMIIDGVINAGVVRIELRNAALTASNGDIELIRFGEPNDKLGYVGRSADFTSKLITARLFPEKSASFALNHVVLYGSPDSDALP